MSSEYDPKEKIQQSSKGDILRRKLKDLFLKERKILNLIFHTD